MTVERIRQGKEIYFTDSIMQSGYGCITGAVQHLPCLFSSSLLFLLHKDDLR